MSKNFKKMSIGDYKFDKWCNIVTSICFTLVILLTVPFLDDIKYDKNDRSISFVVTNKNLGGTYYKYHMQTEYVMVTKCIDENVPTCNSKSFYFETDPVTYSSYDVGDRINFITSPSQLKPHYDNITKTSDFVDISLFFLYFICFITFLVNALTLFFGYCKYDLLLIYDFILFIIWVTLI